MARDDDVRTIKLTVISDYTCPWCYIGHKEIQKAIDKCSEDQLPLDFHVEYRPFLLNPIPDNVKLPRKDFLEKKLGPEKAAAAMKLIAERGRALGLKMTSGGSVQSSMRAHRLTLKAAQLKDDKALDELVFSIYRAYCEDGADISDIDFLAKLADDASIMSKDEAVSFLNSDELKDDVERMVNAARQNGVTGVPFTIVDGKWAVSGGQPSEVYTQIFTKLARVPQTQPSQNGS